MQVINSGQQEGQLTLNTPLPAAGANVTTGILDLSSASPFSNGWQTGWFEITFPNLPENTVAAGITVTLQAAGPSLTNSLPAPQAAVPGAFAAPPVSQVATCAGVALAGSAAQKFFMTLPVDQTGSTYQFVQFVIAVAAGIVTQGENISIAWVAKDI